MKGGNKTYHNYLFQPNHFKLLSKAPKQSRTVNKTTKDVHMIRITLELTVRQEFNVPKRKKQKNSNSILSFFLIRELSQLFRN